MLSEMIRRVVADDRSRARLNEVKPLCGTVMMTDDFSAAVKAARANGARIDAVEILVYSTDPEKNLGDSDRQIAHATRYELGACVATVTNASGSMLVRFQEVGSNRFVVVSRPVTGDRRWRIHNKGVESSGRRAGARSRGCGPSVGPNN